MQIIQY